MVYNLYKLLVEFHWVIKDFRFPLQILSNPALLLGIFLMALNARGRFNKSSRIEYYRNH